MIKFYKPTLRRRDMDSVLQTMVNEQIGPGSVSAEFVNAFNAKTKTAKGMAFRTYPDCIESALRILGVVSGTKVAVSPLSPVVYKSVLEKLGAQIAYVDIDKENGCPRADLVLESEAEVLVLYESFGTLPVLYDNQTTFAEKVDYGSVKVLEDVTQSLGSHVGEDLVPGLWGHAVVCSLEDEDLVSAGGGAVLGVKSQLVTELRQNKPNSYLRMTDLNAALGNVQIANLDSNLEKRRKLSKLYSSALAKTRHKQFGLNLIDFESNSFAFAVNLDVKPDDAMRFAAKHDVPVHLAFEDSMCREYAGDLFESFPVCAACYYRTVLFPIYPFMKDTEADNVSKVISHLP